MTKIRDREQQQQQQLIYNIIYTVIIIIIKSTFIFYLNRHLSLSSMFYPNTLDQRRINNSNGKTLLQNWVEEVSIDKSTIPNIFKSNLIKN